MNRTELWIALRRLGIGCDIRDLRALRHVHMWRPPTTRGRDDMGFATAYLYHLTESRVISYQ